MLCGQSPKAQRKASGISQGIWPSEVSDSFVPTTWAFRNKPWERATEPWTIGEDLNRAAVSLNFRFGTSRTHRGREAGPLWLVLLEKFSSFHF